MAREGTQSGGEGVEAPLPRLILAPLRGVTVATFRRLFVLYYGGCDEAVAPFIPTVSGERIRPALLKDVGEPGREAPMEVVPQIIGKDPAQVGPMAEALRALGYRRLNLNCGCPWKFVAKKGRGSGLLRERDGLRRMLEAGCTAMPGGFSVKVRLGVENAELLAQRVDVFNEFPLESVTVHPRTAVQMYEGRVDLDAFEAVLPHFRAPVLYNGDIFTRADLAGLRARFPSVRGWMIGRGVVRNPSLAQELKGCTLEGNARERLRAFHDALYAAYRAELCGPSPVLGRMKELWGYLYVQFPRGEMVLRNIQRCTTLADFERYVSRAFEALN